MPKTPNPLTEALTEMTSAIKLELDHEERPVESFVETALPGFKQTLKGRRSIRVYDGDPIPENIMRDCLRDAILAPSSSNLQSYELYWIRDTGKKELISKACLSQPPAITAGELVVVVARGDLWKVHLEKLVGIMTNQGKQPLPGPVNDYYTRLVPMFMRDDKFGFYNLVRRIHYWYTGLQQPTMRTPVNRGDHRIYAHVQASLVAQTLLLSLAAHGYESCPIGGMDERRIHKILELPKKAEVSLVIAAGRGKPEGLYGPRVRLPEGDLIQEV